MRSDDLCCTPGEAARESCASDAPGTAVVKGAKLKRDVSMENRIERAVIFFHLSQIGIMPEVGSEVKSGVKCAGPAHHIKFVYSEMAD